MYTKNESITVITLEDRSTLPFPINCESYWSFKFSKLYTLGSCSNHKICRAHTHWRCKRREKLCLKWWKMSKWIQMENNNKENDCNKKNRQSVTFNWIKNDSFHLDVVHPSSILWYWFSWYFWWMLPFIALSTFILFVVMSDLIFWQPHKNGQYFHSNYIPRNWMIYGFSFVILVNKWNVFYVFITLTIAFMVSYEFRTKQQFHKRNPVDRFHNANVKHITFRC